MRSVSAISDLFVDAHLMVYNPADHVEAVAKGGAQMLTFHYEVMPGGAFAYGGINDPDMAIEEAARLIGKIHESGMKAGISIKPKTPWEVLTPLIPLVDLVLVMSVEPGFGGQKFIPESLERIRAIREEANRINPTLLYSRVTRAHPRDPRGSKQDQSHAPHRGGRRHQGRQCQNSAGRRCRHDRRRQRCSGRRRRDGESPRVYGDSGIG